MEQGDVISVVVSPGNGDHTCDLTAVELALSDGTREWSLAKEVSSDILAGNPHADSHGNKEVWHFFSETAESSELAGVPKGSLLARWRETKDAGERHRLATQIRELLQSDIKTVSVSSPEHALHQQLLASAGPLLGSALRTPRLGAEPVESPYGIAASQFGVHPRGAKTEPHQLCVKAPSLIEVRLPAALVDGAELVASPIDQFWVGLLPLKRTFTPATGTPKSSSFVKESFMPKGTVNPLVELFPMVRVPI